MAGGRPDVRIVSVEASATVREPRSVSGWGRSRRCGEAPEVASRLTTARARRAASDGARVA